MSPGSRLLVVALAAGLAACRPAAAQIVGNSCRLSSGRGVCRMLQDCRSVAEAMSAGNSPEKLCGFQSNLPVFCCPLTGGARTTTTSSTTRRSNKLEGIPLNTGSSSYQRPARRMCVEYAKSVYALVDPPVLTRLPPVNVSLCTIQDKKLIVGGTAAEPKEFPHMAAIGYMSGSDVKWLCGGSLISDRFVLTAGHCTVSATWGQAEWVRVGDLNLGTSEDDARPQDRRVSQRIRHPDYRAATVQYNDIALLKLREPVTFDAYVRPACLSLESNIMVGEKAVASGWGVVDWFDEETSDDLLKVTLPVVSGSTCRSAYSNDKNRLPNGINESSQFCAGEEGKDTCQGDSGGPLMVYSKNEYCMYDLIGITSFGRVCGSISPGVYTKVYHYVSWIERIVWPSLA